MINIHILCSIHKTIPNCILYVLQVCILTPPTNVFKKKMKAGLYLVLLIQIQWKNIKCIHQRNAPNGCGFMLNYMLFLRHWRKQPGGKEHHKKSLRYKQSYLMSKAETFFYLKFMLELHHRNECFCFKLNLNIFLKVKYLISSLPGNRHTHTHAVGHQFSFKTLQSKAHIFEKGQTRN